RQIDAFCREEDLGAIVAEPIAACAVVLEPRDRRIERRSGDLLGLFLTERVRDGVFHVLCVWLVGRLVNCGRTVRLTPSPGRSISAAMIGVDFGGTAIKAGIVRDGRVLRSIQVPTPRTEGPDRVMNAIASAVLELEPSPASVGVAIPGEVDPTG